MDKQLKLLRFADLKAAQVVTSWPQLRRLIDNADFPAGFLLSRQVRVWDADDIEMWVEQRRQAISLKAQRRAVG